MTRISKAAIPAGYTCRSVWPFCLAERDGASSTPPGVEAGEWGEWRPGTRSEPCEPDSARFVCDGAGSREITVVSVHQPPGYTSRVFYTIKWVDPNGRVFGSKKLRVMSIGPFRVMLRGHRHPYEIVETSSA